MWGLCELAPYLTDSAQSAMLAEVFKAVLTLPDDINRISRLVYLLPLLNEPERTNALREVIASHRNNKADTLTRHIGQEEASVISAYLPATLLEEALDVKAGFVHGERQFEVLALVKLASYLDDVSRVNIVKEILTRVDLLLVDVETDDILIQIEPLLPDELVSEALNLAHTIKFDISRAIVLAAFLPRLDESERADAAKEAFDIFYRARDDRLRDDQYINELKSVAKYISDPERAKRLQDEVEATSHHRRYAGRYDIVAIANPNLSGVELIDKQLDFMAREIQEGKRPQFESIVPNLPDSLVDKAFAIAKTIEHEFDRTSALVSFIPRFSEPILNETYKIAATMKDAFPYCILAAALVSRIPDKQYELVKNIRKYTLKLLMAQQSSKRYVIAGLFSITIDFFIPPIFSPKALSQIAQSIMDICWEWHWG